MNNPPLQFIHNLTQVDFSSLLNGLFITGLSLVGLLLKRTIYPIKELSRPFFSNAVLNLLIGLPIMPGPIVFVMRERDDWFALLARDTHLHNRYFDRNGGLNAYH